MCMQKISQIWNNNKTNTKRLRVEGRQNFAVCFIAGNGSLFPLNTARSVTSKKLRLSLHQRRKLDFGQNIFIISYYWVLNFNQLSLTAKLMKKNKRIAVLETRVNLLLHCVYNIFFPSPHFWSMILGKPPKNIEKTVMPLMLFISRNHYRCCWWRKRGDVLDKFNCPLNRSFSHLETTP